jgi:hypothetical protein
LQNSKHEPSAHKNPKIDYENGVFDLSARNLEYGRQADSYGRDRCPASWLQKIRVKLKKCCFAKLEGLARLKEIEMFAKLEIPRTVFPQKSKK